MNEEKVYIPFLKRILYKAKDIGSSDIHIKPNDFISFRYNGEIRKAGKDFGYIDERTTRQIFRSILDTYINDEKDIDFIEKSLNKDKHISFSFKDSEIGFKYRANVSIKDKGYYIVIRQNNIYPAKLENLNFDDSTMKALRSITNKSKGLFLVVGATGSGKSTTLSALINEINQEQRKNIITLEDPIEYEYKPAKSNVVQQELGKDIISFAAGLKSSLRQDPDVILVGEIRDLETLELALEAAETGHIVFSTMHTNNALATINRILGMYSSNGDKDLICDRLGSVLLGVLAQKLVPKKDNNGRTVLWELLLTNHAVREKIKKNNINEIKSVFDNINNGSKTFVTVLKHLFINNLISYQTLLNELGDIYPSQEEINKKLQEIAMMRED